MHSYPWLPVLRVALLLSVRGLLSTTVCLQLAMFLLNNTAALSCLDKISFIFVLWVSAFWSSIFLQPWICLAFNTSQCQVLRYKSHHQQHASCLLPLQYLSGVTTLGANISISTTTVRTLVTSISVSTTAVRTLGAHISHIYRKRKIYQVESEDKWLGGPEGHVRHWNESKYLVIAYLDVIDSILHV